MKKVVIKVTIFILFIASFFTNTSIAYCMNPENAALKDYKYNSTMKRDLLCLMMAYPEYIVNVQKGKDNNVYIVMKSGKHILYDDKRQKDFNQKLSNADLQDMMEQVYPLSNDGKLMPIDYDPGRIRVYPFLKDIYGYSQYEVEKNLYDVKHRGTYLPFNKNNRASKELDSALKEVAVATQSNKGSYGYVYPIVGTYKYRLISGTNQLSVHSFGIAIDFQYRKSDYWKWANREQGQKRLSSYPKEVVEVMEKNNFIWGGKWGHFDIMHYEYRPELIMKAKYFSNEPSIDKPWHHGIPLDNSSIKEKIEIIDKVLG